MSDSDGRFLSRWSRLKRRSREETGAGQAGAGADPSTHRGERAMPAQAMPVAGGPLDGKGHPDDVALPATPAAEFAEHEPQAGLAPAAHEGDAPLPPLESLTPGSDFRPFMRAGIDSTTRNAALKRLFADPQFNVMDGLDVYIDDYGKTEPIPQAMLRRLVEEQASRLFDPPIDEASGVAGVGQATGEPVAAAPARGETRVDRGEVGTTGEAGAAGDAVDDRRELPADACAASIASQREPDAAAHRADAPVDDVEPCPGVQRR